MRLKRPAKFTFIISIVFFIFTVTNAQTLQEAQEAYNNGLRLSKTDINASIESYKNCVSILTALGTDGGGIKAKAEMKIPQLYFNIGNAQLKDKKYDDAIKSFEVAYDVAEEYKSSAVKRKCKGILPQIFNSKAATFYQNDDFENALTNYDKALQWDQNYTKAMIGKGMIFTKQDDVDNLKQTMMMTKQIATSKNDTKTAVKADKIIRDYLVMKGVEFLNSNKTGDALTYLEDALYYGEDDIETLYWLTQVYNKQGKYDKAISSINKAISLEKGGDIKAARLYYELGTAYKGKNDVGNACASFKKAKFGKYVESANYEITEVLKCN